LRHVELALAEHPLKLRPLRETARRNAKIIRLRPKTAGCTNLARDRRCDTKSSRRGPLLAWLAVIRKLSRLLFP